MADGSRKLNRPDDLKLVHHKDTDCLSPHSTATMNELFATGKRVADILDIVYLLREYEPMMEDRLYESTVLPALSKHEEYQAMMHLMTHATEFQPIDGLWYELRQLNQDFRLYHSRLNPEPSFRPMHNVKITSFDSDEDVNRTLMNMANMLSWFTFDLRMANSTLRSPPTITASTSHKKDDKWRIQTEVLKLFNQALKEAFPTFREECLMLWQQRVDDIQCDNVIRLWPAINMIKRKSKSKSKSRLFADINGPKDVGMKIKETLVKQKSEWNRKLKENKNRLERKSHMIEGDPRVYGVGFVAIELSGNWMAENIHKMLRDGIDTWAPKHVLEFKSLILYSPSWDECNLMPMDALRRQLIILSQMHMLDYAKSDATTFSGNGMSLPDDVLDKHFLVEYNDGEILIRAKENSEPILRGKQRGGCLRRREDGYPLEDLAALWHGLEVQKTNWMLCVTPSQQQDYVEKCFTAARGAGWTSKKIFWPLTTYVGFKTCGTSLESLLTLLYTVQYPREAGGAAKVLGYTDEAVLDCALTYNFLKNHRLADCEFSYEEMLDIKGDTFVNLLTTLAQIRIITNSYRKDIDELKKALELELEEDQLIWSQGVDRVLGLHILMFTELINEASASFLPHLICGFLFNLSKKFRGFYESYESSGFEDKTRLLLCEATAVVMEKGFHLLGVTKKPSLPIVSAALALNYLAPSRFLKPIAKPNVRTRFEILTALVKVTRDPEFVDGELFGSMEISDYYGSVPEGWVGSPQDLGPGDVQLLAYGCLSPVKILNDGHVKISDPKSRHSVPFGPWMRVSMLLIAKKDEADFFRVCNFDEFMNFSWFLKRDLPIFRGNFVAQGADGHMRINYILIRDAVDADIKVKLDWVGELRLSGQIFAYYNGYDSEYTASLLQCYGDSSFTKGALCLTRSRLAVPAKGTLVIVAQLEDSEGAYILEDSCDFSTDCNTMEPQIIKSKDCTCTLEVTWSLD